MLKSETTMIRIICIKDFDGKKLVYRIQ